jgi:thioredoxin 2
MQLVCPDCGTKNRVPDDRLTDNPLCGRCGAALMAAEPVALDERRFDRYLQGTELPMAPQFAAAAAQLPRVRFAKLDTEAAQRTSARHAIRSIPTLVLFRDGSEVARRSGALPTGEIVGWLKAQLA